MQSKDLAVFNEMPFFAWAKDEAGRYIFANQALVQFAGVEVVGKHDRELPWAANAETLLADDQQVLDSGKELRRRENVDMPDSKKAALNTCKCPKELDGKRCTFGISFIMD